MVRGYHVDRSERIFPSGQSNVKKGFGFPRRIINMAFVYSSARYQNITLCGSGPQSMSRGRGNEIVPFFQFNCCVLE